MRSQGRRTARVSGRKGDTRIRFMLSMLVLLLALLTVPVAAAVIRFDPPQLQIAPGGEGYLVLVLDQAPEGLAGCFLTLRITSPDVATITGYDFPPWAVVNSSSGIPGGFVSVTGINLLQDVKPGDKDIPLGLIRVRGLADGSTRISVVVDRLESVEGVPLDPSIERVRIRVGTGSAADDLPDEALEEDTGGAGATAPFQAATPIPAMTPDNNPRTGIPPWATAAVLGFILIVGIMVSALGREKR
jgi:hypothetical protein